MTAPSISPEVLQAEIKKAADFVRYPAARREQAASKTYDETADGQGDRLASNLHGTDIGNGRRLVLRHGDNIRHCPEHGRWYLWTGRIWAPDTTKQMDRLAKDTVVSIYGECEHIGDDETRKARAKHAMRSESAARLNAMLTMASSESEVVIAANELNTNPWLLTVRNGTLDLRAGALRPHNPKDLITRLVDVVWDPDATAPVWRRFLARIFHDDAQLISYMQRAMGYSLTGDVSEQVLFYLYGRGRNGKSTLMDVLSAAAGDYHTKLNSEALMIKRLGGIPNDIAALAGARVVTSAELEEGRTLAESLVKDLTGGDDIAARFLNQEWFKFRSQFKLWLYGNHKIQVKGTDDGIWRRIKLIPFDVQIPKSEVDTRLNEKLKAEMPGILAWIVEGCLEWQTYGLGEPQAVVRATQDYRDEEDALGSYLRELCSVDGQAEDSAKNLYGAYQELCRQNGERPMSQKMFGRGLKERGYSSKRETEGIKWYGLELSEAGRKLAETWNLRQSTGKTAVL